MGLHWYWGWSYLRHRLHHIRLLLLVLLVLLIEHHCLDGLLALGTLLGLLLGSDPI
jgi:hypothetical protein